MVDFTGTEQSLTKLKITVLDRDGVAGESFDVLFNPTEYTLTRNTTYAEQNLLGLTTPVTQFVSGTAETLSMELFFDTYEKGTDVRKSTNRLDQLLTVDGEVHEPPRLLVEWSSLTFRCVLESATKRFTLFLPNGTPVRARVDVTFKQYDSPRWERLESPRSSPDKTKIRRLTEGDSLALIAAREYGDPAHWRTIAAANDIDNPRTVTPGRDLVLPALEEV
ncbi:Nucleoid-associated protein YgaU, contains BON and LysM domains [Halogranum amylolyticum]|uniref:Nucleoid-associated protein YgaU, contains BON and LysM domains n=1 Tax=Halogranum amylolyticum TaxID=660520 RepID=A0A1H8WGB8_9EURY|nr:LysM peptidoglycan-binding domain-containing protein [Halogranum amylolyticum]SEP26563.1 Nucleoid-associated protein YgaU, contains BON and LysM domains [Halogranum amylolyticum]